ncbi:hypothetical protein EDD18DRAFT_1100293 [Armillaria luteobubalina]|uniref:Uncharacterized protein n=1 Tax=Armillaria luteobubalina TaxID=153913 RepID=A0AA39QKD9_9AGAR|nr:hypothetical protein EDD18DRAFT_1100293 [Armillaria luteobubalina]
MKTQGTRTPQKSYRCIIKVETDMEGQYNTHSVQKGHQKQPEARNVTKTKQMTRQLTNQKANHQYLLDNRVMRKRIPFVNDMGPSSALFRYRFQSSVFRWQEKRMSNTWLKLYAGKLFSIDPDNSQSQESVVLKLAQTLASFLLRLPLAIMPKAEHYNAHWSGHAFPVIMMHQALAPTPGDSAGMPPAAPIPFSVVAQIASIAGQAIGCLSSCHQNNTVHNWSIEAAPNYTLL